MTNDRGTAAAARESAALTPREAFCADQLDHARREAGAAAAALALACRITTPLPELSALALAANQAAAELRMAIQASRLAS